MINMSTSRNEDSINIANLNNYYERKLRSIKVSNIYDQCIFKITTKKSLVPIIQSNTAEKTLDYK